MSAAYSPSECPARKAGRSRTLPASTVAASAASPCATSAGCALMVRVSSASARSKQMRSFAPELHAIHPTDALEADEEIVFLADAFLSHVPEASCNVPAYRSWLDDQDFTPAYRYLHRMLQLLHYCGHDLFPA